MEAGWDFQKNLEKMWRGKDSNMKTIETERLILRNFEDSGYDDLYEFLSQRKVMMIYYSCYQY